MILYQSLKRLLFTHIDLDGYGCAVVLKSIYPDIDICHVNYDFFDNIEYRKKVLDYDEVYITDISVSEGHAKLLDNLVKNSNSKLSKVVLLDHHESAEKALLPLGFDWINIDKSRCGTKLCYDYFINLGYNISHLDYFVTLVNDYDLWLHKNRASTNLQFLWSSMDKSKFVDRFVNANYDENGNFILTNSEVDMIYDQVAELDDSVELCESTIEVYTDCEGNKFGYIPLVKRFVSLAVSRVLDKHPELSYIVTYNGYGNSLSFRSKTYPVNLIAEALGGGGHRLAAGAPTVTFMNIPKSVAERKVITRDLMSNINKGVDNL